nr:DNA-3-methyladenine glycosylase I [Streptococcus gordonii]
NKRKAFREAINFYHSHKNTKKTDAELDAIMDNHNIVRNKMKNYATRAKAQAFLAVQNRFCSFND